MSPVPLVRVLERRTWFAPIGVRFTDAATGQPVTDSLDVTFVSLADDRVRVAAVANPSRVYVLHAFPGLPRDGAAYLKPDAPAASPPWRGPANRRVRIEVRDPAGRYLPLNVVGDIPNYGLFSPSFADASPPSPTTEPSIPLYRGASQSTSGACAVIRADLRDIDKGQPVAWAVEGACAVIRADLRDIDKGQPVAWAVANVFYRDRLLGRSVSDAEGRLTLVFPFPELVAPRIMTSPAPASPPTLREMATWQVSLRIASSRAVSRAVVPELCALHGQAPARAFASRAPDVDLTDVSIGLGNEAILRSFGERHLLLIPGS